MDAIFKRYSVRKYTDEKISDEDIEKLLRSAMQAPSGGNQQPWRFTVVTNSEKLKELSKISLFSSFVKDSAAAIVASSTTKKLRFPELVPLDIAIACEHILLEAVELGFGGTYLAVYPQEDRIAKVKKIIETEDTPIALISLGYPKDDHKIQDRYDESKVEYIR